MNTVQKISGALAFLFLCAPASTFAQLVEFDLDLMTPAELPALDPKLVTPDALESSILTDNNGNGRIEIAAFGDSITRGVGDFIGPNQEIFDVTTPTREAGYPLRIENLLGIPVSNLGVPAERLVTGGLPRFINVIPRLLPDIVIIGGGSNDARPAAAPRPGQFFRAMQTMVNVSRAIGVQPVVVTIVPACCGHGFLQRFINTFNPQIRNIAHLNSIPLADVDRGYRNTCNVGRCNLLNLPEGLHPNTPGYDVFGEVVMASLLRINLFAPDGPSLLAQALGVPEGSIRTKPDAVPEEPAPVAPEAPSEGTPETPTEVPSAPATPSTPTPPTIPPFLL